MSLYEKYGLKPVINAAGRMTVLGVSTPGPEVIAAVDDGLAHYFDIGDLVDKTGAYIAGLVGAEAAVVVSCASAGLAQAVAALIVRDDGWLRDNLHAAPLRVPHHIVLPKGHNVHYGAPIATMVRLGGGRVVEAGYANECTPAQLAAALDDRCAAVLYVKSHHCVQKSHLSVAQAAEVAHQHDLPLIVDAAAEEDLRAYLQAGADLVIYSGAKAIAGPTSGLVLGKAQYIAWLKQQSSGIGRAMKVGKESILGLTQAIEHYLTQPGISGAQMVEKMTPFIASLNALSGISARVVWDTAGRDIARAEIHVDETLAGLTAGDLVQALKTGPVAIYFRGYKANEGIIEADVRSVSAAQLVTIADAIRTRLEEKTA
ncbi:DgaE family pyridoxal phosphate-dependent ammonia lyase [Pantoea sp. 1.19]|uniref:DgaE family pyridoxal phosphate-dependent ammonia lyase n=1 Tax=Pantoea sp. 1.19 TaxID=1925589 RepID=UPI00094892B5|nr:DgaE family pyridoxal phosphate-dependent ammonia lyase [Pantoea sp. 1.19]